MRCVPDRVAKFANESAGVHARLPSQRGVIHFRAIFPQTLQRLRASRLLLKAVPPYTIALTSWRSSTHARSGPGAGSSAG